MGWLDSFGLTKKDEDPLVKDLDPELRKYLQSQAPSSYRTAQEKTGNSSATPKTYREQLGLGHNDPEAQQKAKDARAAAAASTAASVAAGITDAEPATSQPLPRESLYQDGRYAHLWSTYRPIAEVEEAGKSDQEKLLDIVHGYKDRQAEVGRAAMENCSNEQWAVHECFRSGTWSARMTMCKQENRDLNRCITMQSKFLRALGYLTMYERPAEESERIQMHADTLYQRMLEQEKDAKEGKKEGREPATVAAAGAAADMAQESGLSLTPVQLGQHIDPSVSLPLPPPGPINPNRINWETLPPHIQEKVMKGRFASLQGVELELAKRELGHNLSFHQDFVERMDRQAIEEKKKSLQRVEAGEQTIGDRVKGLFDFRQYNTLEVPKAAEGGKK